MLFVGGIPLFYMELALGQVQSIVLLIWTWEKRIRFRFSLLCSSTGKAPLPVGEGSSRFSKVTTVCIWYVDRYIERKWEKVQMIRAERFVPNGRKSNNGWYSSTVVIGSGRQYSRSLSGWGSIQQPIRILQSPGIRSLHCVPGFDKGGGKEEKKIPFTLP